MIRLRLLSFSTLGRRRAPYPLRTLKLTSRVSMIYGLSSKPESLRFFNNLGRDGCVKVMLTQPSSILVSR